MGSSHCHCLTGKKENTDFNLDPIIAKDLRKFNNKQTELGYWLVRISKCLRERISQSHYIFENFWS